MILSFPTIRGKKPMRTFRFSRTKRVLLTSALLAAATFLTGVAQAQSVFRVTTIPEEAATEQVRKFTPLATYLEKALGVKVEFTPVSDYPAAVETLVNKKVDLVWFGGFTFVQANLRSGGKVVPLAQREEDTKFQSVFIAKTDSGIKSLADMKGKQVSFGSQSSTSGHLMPRSFLLQANINPEKDFRRIAYSGAHDATIASVVSGKVDAAALDITVWKKFVAENKVDTQAVNVFYTTPGYFNYNWSVHADMPAAMQAKVKAALLALDPANPEHAEILRLNRASRYIATTPDNYKGLEAAARSAGLL
jgi:phosphonate transport system substrate-binding protein